MSWIRCSDLLKRVHLLLISCSRSDHCGRSIFRSFPAYNVNQTHKHRFTYCSLKNSGEIGTQQKESSIKGPYKSWIVVPHFQEFNFMNYWLITIFSSVSVFFFRRVLILWTVLCCSCSLRLTQAQGKQFLRQGWCLLAFLLLNSSLSHKKFQVRLPKTRSKSNRTLLFQPFHSKVCFSEDVPLDVILSSWNTVVSHFCLVLV